MFWTYSVLLHVRAKSRLTVVIAQKHYCVCSLTSETCRPSLLIGVIFATTLQAFRHRSVRDNNISWSAASVRFSRRMADQVQWERCYVALWWNALGPMIVFTCCSVLPLATILWLRCFFTAKTRLDCLKTRRRVQQSHGGVKAPLRAVHTCRFVGDKSNLKIGPTRDQQKFCRWHVGSVCRSDLSLTNRHVWTAPCALDVPHLEHRPVGLRLR